MNIKEIDKSTYRERLNKVIIGFIVMLAVLSLSFGSLLIALFVDSSITVNNELTTEQPSNFKYNFLGVLLALLACAAILNSIKDKVFFKEIYYVWQLKQTHNLIYRKLKNIKRAAFEQDDVTAIELLNYYYQGLKQVYELDDNTLTMDKVIKDHDALLSLVESKNLTLKNEPFNKALLINY